MIRALSLIVRLRRELNRERAERRELEERIRDCTTAHDSLMRILLQRHVALENYRNYVENQDTALKHCTNERDVLRDLLDQKGESE